MGTDEGNTTRHRTMGSMTYRLQLRYTKTVVGALVCHIRGTFGFVLLILRFIILNKHVIGHDAVKREFTNRKSRKYLFFFIFNFSKIKFIAIFSSQYASLYVCRDGILPDTPGM